jgi:lipoate-protein ligase A
MVSSHAADATLGKAWNAPLPQADKREWHLWIDDAPRPGWANMAIDQTLLDRAGQLDESWLRLYSWKPHCLSFGRHEPAARRYDAERIAALGIDTVRRPTGGRAVWHSRELTYAIAAPCRCFGSLQEAYLKIHRMLVDALLGLGVPASLAPPTRSLALDAGACFSQPAGGEIMVDTRKVVGSAQLRCGGAFLQHGSILLQDEQHVVAGVARGRALVPQLLPCRLGGVVLGDLIRAITGAVQAHWPGHWRRISRSEEMLQSASPHYPRFRSPAWTWQR